MNYHNSLLMILVLLTAMPACGCKGASVSHTSARDEEPLMAARIEGERILRREGYTVSYNGKTRQPNYVVWTLTPERLRGHAKRAEGFSEDNDLNKSERSMLDDYRSSGMDRGHMCPAGDNKWSQTAINETFLLSNICPQNHTLNSGDWNDLENACRNWVRESRERVYVVCGPIFETNPRKIKKRVSVPSGFFKLLLCTDKGHEKGIAFIYKNSGDTQPMEAVACSIDEVELLTGYDFFTSLNKKMQDRLEAQHALKAWKLTFTPHRK